MIKSSEKQLGSIGGKQHIYHSLTSPKVRDTVRGARPGTTVQAGMIAIGMAMSYQAPTSTPWPWWQSQADGPLFSVSTHTCGGTCVCC